MRVVGVSYRQSGVGRCWRWRGVVVVELSYEMGLETAGRSGQPGKGEVRGIDFIRPVDTTSDLTTSYMKLAHASGSTSCA